MNDKNWLLFVYSLLKFFYLAYFQINNIVACINNFIPLYAEYSIVWIYHSLFIYLSVDMWIISNLGLLEIKLNEYSHTCLPMVEFTSEAMWVSSFLHKKVFNKRFNFFSDRAIVITWKFWSYLEKYNFQLLGNYLEFCITLTIVSSNLFFYFVSNLLFF